MKVQAFKDVTLEDVNAEGAKNAKIRWLIAKEDGAPHFATRLFEIGEGGCTPFHKHGWEHEAIILEGEGALVTDDGEFPFQPEDAVYVDPEINHQFKNTGKGMLRFLCIIPHQEILDKPKKVVNPFAAGRANNC